MWLQYTERELLIERNSFVEFEWLGKRRLIAIEWFVSEVLLCVPSIEVERVVDVDNTGQRNVKVDLPDGSQNPQNPVDPEVDGEDKTVGNGIVRQVEPATPKKGLHEREGVHQWGVVRYEEVAPSKPRVLLDGAQGTQVRPGHVAGIRLLEFGRAVTNAYEDATVLLRWFETVDDVVWIALAIHDVRSKTDSVQATFISCQQ